MFEQMPKVRDRYEELERSLNDPVLMQDHELYRKLSQEKNSLDPVIEAYEEYLAAVKAEQESAELVETEKDPEIREMAKEELPLARRRVQEAENRLKILLLPKDPNDSRNVFIEIRSGVGGDEAGLFAAVLFRMYTRYAERRRYRVSVMDGSENDIGGIKEITFQVTGSGAYSRFKYESGVHRVRRVPVTESGGRIHTSAATVAVLPEIDDANIEIRPEDLRIDVYRASGNGGQYVNKTDSAVRIVHIPTGIVVTCQDEKSQLMNKEKALKELRSRLYAAEQEKIRSAVTADRRSQVGSGDRSEKIRTYNYLQSRVTDHRIGYTIYQMDDFLDGNMDPLIDLLTSDEQTRKLLEMSENADL